MTCTFCGAEIEEGTVFCTSCGNRINSELSSGFEAESEDIQNESAAYDEITPALDSEKTDETSAANDEEDLSMTLDEVTEKTVFDSEETEAAPDEEITDGEETEAVPDEEVIDGEATEAAPGEEVIDGEATEAAPGEEVTGAEDAETAPDEEVTDGEATEAAPGEEVAASEEAQASEDIVPQEEVSVQETKADASQNANAKLSMAIVMLSAALLAICGFLFVDKLLSLTPSDSRASTIHIVSQSQDVTVKPGTPTEFFVDAEGTNLKYQWYVKKSGEQLWHLWKGHDNFKTNSMANESWDGMQVYCMIVDNNRTAVASEIITISIEKSK